MIVKICEIAQFTRAMPGSSLVLHKNSLMQTLPIYRLLELVLRVLNVEAYLLKVHSFELDQRLDNPLLTNDGRSLVCDLRRRLLLTSRFHRCCCLWELPFITRSVVTENIHLEINGKSSPSFLSGR